MNNLTLINRIKTYNIYYIKPNFEKGFNFGYILAVPDKMEDETRLIVESNNLEKSNETELIESAYDSVIEIGRTLFETNAPAIVPILPSLKSGMPYFQQLSRECFSNDLEHRYKRIDLQVFNIIEDAKNNIMELTKRKVADKIFLKGYSSSGVFAQRFALLHPNIIDSLCIGGAIGSIPIPLVEYMGEKLKYPIGISDFKEITGTNFEIEDYKKIKFNYYVGEKESETKSQTRKDEFGNFAPMHDMSYMHRSTTNEMGNTLRRIFGIDMMNRFKNQIKVYIDNGYNITTKIYPGKYHNRINGQNGLMNDADDDILNFYNKIEENSRGIFLKHLREQPVNLNDINKKDSLQTNTEKSL